MAGGISEVTIRNRQFPPEEVVFGKSSAMDELRKRLERVARTDVPILVRGEAGSGKEILARLVHRRYPGETRPFRRVTTNGRNGWLKSSSFVLPGEDAGPDVRYLDAAPEDHRCLGSLFFEEIAEMNTMSQRRLVRLLHDGQPLGMEATGYTPNLFRVICSTQHDLERLVGVGSFRGDLFYLINVVSLCVPPLRERREDIPGLAYYLWERCREEFCSDAQEPSSRLISAFQEYAWPGNVRELANMMKCYALLGSEEKIVSEMAAKAHHPPTDEPSAGGTISLKHLARQEVQEVERKIILRTLHATKWNRKRAARMLKISYRTLLYKIKEAGVPPKRADSKRERLN
ncbi:MAG: sigma 54-interacting transcriptional regulator [Acidobacteriota bacterium]